jgi:hypothetical protein
MKIVTIANKYVVVDKKQDRKCATLFQWKSNNYYVLWVCLCNFFFLSSVQCACTILSSVACPALQRFYSHYLKKVTIFEKKKLLNIKYLYWFALKRLSETFLILRKTERDIGLRVNYQLFLSDFNETCIFLIVFSKITQMSNFMKIRPMGAELFHLDRRTDRRDEANSRLSQVCESTY